MFRKIIKRVFVFLGISLSVIFGLTLALLGYFNLPVSNTNVNARLGVTFSDTYATSIGLDWKAAYTAMLDDLKIRKIRIPVYWSQVEPYKGGYDFADVDWELSEAKKRGAEIILAVGQKTPRWPECNVPDWAKNDKQAYHGDLLKYIDTTVRRYKSDPTVKYWQVENEPFLGFGICPPADANLLDSEIALVHNIDPTRKVIVTDSGELGMWIPAASRADIFGTTMYRTIWKKGIGYYQYPIGPRFFQFKDWLIKTFAHQYNAIVIELQAEPWINGETTTDPLSEQFKSMNPDQLRTNVDYAEKVGFPQIYLWGVEWWYWLKVKENHPEMWDAAKKLYADPR